MPLSPTRRGIIIDLSILALALTVFFYLSATNINLPGLYYDEALDVVPTMQIVLGQPVEVWTGGGVSVGGTTFPVMISSYVGTVNTYLMLPFFYLLGVNVSSLRLMTILFGGFALVLYYLFIKDFLHRRAAAITALLLAVHPSFVFWSRQGIYVTSVMTFTAAASLFCFWRWYRGNIDRRLETRDRYLYAGTFLLGLGLSAKFLFLWFIIALAASYYMLQISSLPSRHSLTDRKVIGKILAFNMSAKQLVLSLLSFCVGAGGLLWYNLKTWGTLKILGKNLITTDQGVNNLDFFSNLLTQIKAFLVLIKGGWFDFYGGSFDNSLYPVMFCVSVAGLAFLFLFFSDRAGKHKTKAVFLLSMFALLLFQSCFTVSGLGATHLLIMLPLPQLIIALFMETLYQVVAPKRASENSLCSVIARSEATKQSPNQEEEIASSPAGARNDTPIARSTARLAIFQTCSKLFPPVVMATVVLALIAQDLRGDFRYHQALQRSGGTGRFSDAIYELAEYLEDNHVASPVAVDWGFKNNIQILTKGTVNPVEIFQYNQNPDEGFFREVSRRLGAPNNLYLFHAEEFTSFKRYDAFEKAVHEADKVMQLQRTFCQRDGTPIYYLYRVIAPGQGYCLWKEGEEYEAGLGSQGEDYKAGASNSKCLGMGWGDEASHFVLYRIHVAEDLPDAYIYLRYAHPDARARRLNIYLDDELVGTRPSVVLPGSGGWGYEESEWATVGLALGPLGSGEHWIKIQPDGDHNAINLDGFYIGGAE